MQKVQDVQRSFGLKVREFRESLGLTREELAEKAGYSPQNLAKIENGDRFVTSEALERLSSALNASPSEFFEGSEKKLSQRSAVRKKLNTLLDRQEERKLAMIFDVATRILKEMSS